MGKPCGRKPPWVGPCSSWHPPNDTPLRHEYSESRDGRDIH
jgi:hypothetical protein